MKEILYTGSCVFDVAVLYILYESVLDRHREEIPSWLVFLGLAIQQGITTFFSYQLGGAYVTLIVQLICAFAITFFYRSTLLRRFMVTFMFILFALVSEILAKVIMDLYVIDYKEEEEMVALILIELFMMILVLITKMFQKNSGDIPTKYQAGFVLCPLLSIVSLSGMCQGKPTLTWAVSVMSLLCLNIVSYYLLNVLIGYVMEKNEKSQMQYQVENQKQKYQQLSDSFVKGNRLLHDVNKHMRLIKEYIGKDETEKALEYMEQIDDSFRSVYNSFNTGNLVVDSILSDMKSRLDKVMCSSSFDIQIDKNSLLLEDYDMVVILGNVADNVVEAISGIEEEKCRFVELHLKTKDCACLIHVKNSRAGGKKEKNRWFHGLGMKNVEDTVAKYGGTVAKNERQDMYELMIQIPIAVESK